jgi:hypothetical protein
MNVVVHIRRCLLAMAIAVDAATFALPAGSALAYLPATGVGAGSVPLARLAQPAGVKASVEGTSVALSWSAGAAPGGGTVSYYLTRDGGQPAGTCPTPASPSTLTSCTDSGLGAGSHLYTVVAVWRSWSTTSATVEAVVAKPQSQTISFTSTAPTKASVGGATYKVSASASSGLPVTLTIDASAKSVCSLSGSTVSFAAPGSCVIDANQAGNGSYEPAAQAQQTFTVSKGTQSIKFSTTPPKEPLVSGAGYSVAASASSGLPVTLTIDASAKSVCSLSGSTVSFAKAGICVVDATQAGNSSYEAAMLTQQSFTVGLTLAITSAEVTGLERYVIKGNGMPEDEVSVSVCKANEFPCSASQLVQTIGAIVSLNGEWSMTTLTLSKKKTYYVQASDAELAVTSAVYKFTAG